MNDTDWSPAPSTEPWERQPGETDKSWEMFCRYRDMGGSRSLRGMARLYGKKPTYAGMLEKWAVDHHWRKRVEAWDAYQDQVNREAQTEARRNAARDMVDRHLRISTHMQRLASVELLRWIHKIGGDRDNPDANAEPSLTPDQIQRLLDYAVKLERLNRDEPGEITETREVRQTREEIESRINHLLKLREQ